MSIETTLTLVTFAGIVAASLMIRILVMTPYRLVRRFSRPQTAEAGWPQEGRIAKRVKGASGSLPGFVSEKLAPLSVFVVASIAGSVKKAAIWFGRSIALVAGCFVAGLTSIGAFLVSLPSWIGPELDSLGTRALETFAEASYVPAQRYSILSADTIRESMMWRSIADGNGAIATSSQDGFMGSFRRTRPHPQLASLMMNRRQAV